MVSGSPGSGKTTLAHALAKAIPCPAICRDEIREGIVHTRAPATPDEDQAIAWRTYDLFFSTVELLLHGGVSLVAEAAFQHRLWEPKLTPLADRAAIRVIRCLVEPDRARARIADRIKADASRRGSHPDAEFLARIDSGDVSLEAWEPIRMDVPTLVVDTSSSYEPGFDSILSFART